MKKIELATAWTYRTPEVTIDYPAGEHSVRKDIADAAEAAGVIKEGKADGGVASKDGAPGSGSAAQG